ncbi:MAG: LytTR family DNA-binding domain-containing protein [Gemmatimonadaceae bacterium]
MSALRVLIVDDEKPARQRLRALLGREAEMEIVGECGDGGEAIDALRDAVVARRPVNVVFLDVQMPEIDGFGVVEALADAVGLHHLPFIVFVTAYDRYALRAFDAHAVDYLLKPYSDERFQLALGRAATIARAGDVESMMRRLERLLGEVRPGRDVGDTGVPPSPTGPHLDRIVLRDRGRVRLLSVTDVAWIAADGVYVRLHTAQRTTHLHRALLGELEAALDPRRFVRIHRSTIVNLDWIEEMQPESHGEYAVVLKDRTVLRLSRSYRAAVQALLGQRI